MIEVVLFLILFILILLLWIIGFVISIISSFIGYALQNKLKKYPSLYKGALIIYSPMKYKYINPKKYALAKKLFYKQYLLLGSFSKDKFDESFDLLYNYKGIRRTDNKELIALVNKLRKLSRIKSLVFNIALLIIFSEVTYGLIKYFIFKSLL